MSGPQHVAWYRTAMEQLGFTKLIDLQIAAAPQSADFFDDVRERLVDMSRGGEHTDG